MKKWKNVKSSEQLMQQKQFNLRRVKQSEEKINSNPEDLLSTIVGTLV